MKPSQWIHTEPAIIFKMKSDREMCSEKKQKAWIIHMNLIENLVLIHYARKLCMCVLTLVAHSRAFFTIEAPALNDFSFYHYYYHHHHERTTTTTTTMCALRSDSSRQQNHEEVV